MCPQTILLFLNVASACSPLLFCFVNFSFVDGSAGTIYACGDAIYDLIRPPDAQKLSLTRLNNS